MSDPVYIRALAVKQTVGFPHERLRPMEFCDGINLIVGPNASGKTTTVRALQAVLWPQTGRAETYLTAELSYRGAQGRVVYTGGHRQVDLPLVLPAFGDASVSRRYMLAQHELLAAQETGEDFARIILNEARGGFDMEAARQLLGYTVTAQNRSPKEYFAAQRVYRDAKDAEHALQRDEVRAGELTRLLDAATQAQHTAQRLLQALEYLAQRAEVARRTAELSVYPAELANLTGRELEEVDAFTKDITTAQEQALIAQRASDASARRLRDTALTDPPAVEQSVASLRALSDTVASLEQQIAIARGDRQRAESEAKSAYENLGGEDLAAYADPLSAATVSALEGFVRAVEGQQARRDGVTELSNWLESITPPADPLARESVRQAMQTLRQWLALGQQTPSPSAWLPLAGMLAAVFVIIAGLLATTVGKSAFGLLAIVGGIAAVVLFQLLRSKAPTTLTHAALQEQLAGLRVDGPAAWTPGDVERLLQELEARLVAMDLREKAGAKRQELLLSVEQLSEKLTALDPERTRIAAQLGVDPARAYAHGQTGLLYFVSQLLRWQERRAQLRQSTDALDTLEQSLRATLAQANAPLGTYGYAPATSANELRNFIMLLDGRRIAYLQAVTDKRAADERIIEQQTHAAEVTRKCGAWLARLALPPDPALARQQLTVLLPRLEDYQATARLLRDASAVCAEINKKGQDNPQWAALIAVDAMELQRQHAQAAQQADEISKHTAEKAECELRLKLGKEQAACEAAQVALERSEVKLRQKLEQALQAAVGDYLIRELNAQTMDAQLPEVFLRARTRLAEYTSGRYELQVHRDGHDFRALDTLDHEERTLDQLSSATRIQLLLAVRVAFVEKCEQGIALPLLMDETLASTDALRERAIIATTLQICREGRQIFYCTSKPHEAATWEALARESGVPLRMIQLDETPAERVMTPQPLPPATVPAPAGMTSTNYALVLGVPQLDFAAAPASNAHLWYVLDQPDYLYTLLSAGIATCGQFNNGALRPFVQGVLGEELTCKTLAGVELLAHIETLWHEGRGLALTYQALQETGILSTDTFRKEITELAEQCTWDAAQLLAQFKVGQVKRLRAESIERFVDYCEEHGYLVDGDPLPPDTIGDHLLGYAATLIEQQVMTAVEVRALCNKVFGHAAGH
jgi:energy-coupling factor transporter ATP-binding protein EcfA2